MWKPVECPLWARRHRGRKKFPTPSEKRACLFLPQCVDGIERGGAAGGSQQANAADDDEQRR